MLVARANARYNSLHAEPYCRCWHKRMKPKVAVPAPWEQLNECSCGEEDDSKLILLFINLKLKIYLALN